MRERRPAINQPPESSDEEEEEEEEEESQDNDEEEEEEESDGMSMSDSEPEPTNTVGGASCHNEALLSITITMHDMHTVTSLK